MLSDNSSLADIKEIVKECLDELYAEEGSILERNKGRGVSERAIVFRFAHYLQERSPDHFVDCDFNSSYKFEYHDDGTFVAREKHGKPIRNAEGIEKKRFIDIIVHKRLPEPQNDLICFEIKKWNNKRTEDIKKDKNNLQVLTSASEYGYVYGFHLIIHKTKSQSKWTIFSQGEPMEPEARIFLS